MQKSKLAVALGTAVALVAAPAFASTSASASSGTSNSGSSVTQLAQQAPTAHIAKGGWKQIMFPDEYSGVGGEGCAKKDDLSGYADFTPIGQLKGASKGMLVNFTPGLEKRSVPNSWATWGSPPDTETATPHILYTAGATSITITFTKKSGKPEPTSCFGVEVEPNPFAVHTFTAVYTNKAGKTMTTITRDADGSAGARVLAAATAKDKDKVEVAQVVISSDVDFAIAQIYTGN